MVAAVNDPPLLHRDESEGRPHETGLAGTGLADNGDRFAGAHGQVDAFDRLQWFMTVRAVSDLGALYCQDLVSVHCGRNIRTIQARRGGQQRLRVFMLWPREHISRCPFFHEPATLEHDHALAMAGDHAKVVRD